MAVLANPRHEAFAQGIVAGKTQKDAYRDAFPDAVACSDKTLINKGCLLAADPDVAARIVELKAQSSCNAIINRQDRMILLTEIATNEMLHPKQRMTAIDILNKMDGDYVKKVEATIKNDFAHTASDIEAILDED